MPPRHILCTKRIWNPNELPGFTLTPKDREEGVKIDIKESILNSILISVLMPFLAKANNAKVKVEITVHDDLTYRSLHHIGVGRLATLIKGSARYPHAPHEGASLDSDQL